MSWESGSVEVCIPCIASKASCTGSHHATIRRWDYEQWPSQLSVRCETVRGCKSLVLGCVFVPACSPQRFLGHPTLTLTFAAPLAHLQLMMSQGAAEFWVVHKIGLPTREHSLSYFVVASKFRFRNRYKGLSDINQIIRRHGGSPSYAVSPPITIDINGVVDVWYVVTYVACCMVIRPVVTEKSSRPVIGISWTQTLQGEGKPGWQHTHTWILQCSFPWVMQVRSRWEAEGSSGMSWWMSMTEASSNANIYPNDHWPVPLN